MQKFNKNKLFDDVFCEIQYSTIAQTRLFPAGHGSWLNGRQQPQMASQNRGA